VQNLLNTSVSTIMWICVGYGLYAHSGPALFGSDHVWFPSLADAVPGNYLLTSMLASTTSNLVSGSVAERIDARAYLLIAALMSGVIFPVAARSVWYPKGANLQPGF
jgi:ammonium transporter, Amt family